MTTLDDFTFALARFSVVLAVNDVTKGDEWRTKTVLEHLSHLASHVTQARLILVNGIDHTLVVGGHTFDEHVSHAFVRAGMALETWLQEGH